MNQGLNRSKGFYRWVAVIGAFIGVGAALMSTSQAEAAGTCNEVDLSVSLVHARWLPRSRGPVRIMEATFRLRNQGAKNSRNPTLSFRPLSRLQGYVAPQPVRVGPIPAGHERLVPVLIPVFIRNNASAQLPELIASVNPESPRRDCFPANNQVRVYPMRPVVPPSTGGSGQSAGLWNEIVTVIPDFNEVITVDDGTSEGDGASETEPAGQ